MKQFTRYVKERTYVLNVSILRWIIKWAVMRYDALYEFMAFSFSGGERKEYNIIVDRYYDDHWTHGVKEYLYSDRNVNADT